MALPLRRPLLSTTLYSSPSPLLSLLQQQQQHQQQQQRCFSYLPRRCASMRGIEGAMPNMSLGPSLRSQMKEQMEIREDVGVFPQTFVNPITRANIPSPITQPLTYLLFRWVHLRTRIWDHAQVLAFKYASPRTTSIFRRTVKLRKRQIVPTAIALHQKMYQAFAEGDTDTLRQVCVNGIYDNFVSRLKARKRGERWVWEVVRYNRVSPVLGSGARLVSLKGARVELDGTGLLQGVVRIHSRQRLTRYKEDGSVVEGSGGEKDVEELVVVQKWYKEWVAEEWKVWGMVGETTGEDVRRWKEEKENE